MRICVKCLERRTVEMLAVVTSWYLSKLEMSLISYLLLLSYF